MDDLHIWRQHHITARISVFIVRTQFKYSMLTEIKDLETLELFDSIVFDANYLKAGGTFKTIVGMPYKPYSYLMEQYVVCFRKLSIFSVGNKTVMDKLSVGVMTHLDKLYNQCYKTPVALVNNILDRLPVEVWSEPEKTFFDPSCGTGEFIVQVQKRLMAGLVMIPEKERLDYINNNMLYFNDINNNWVEWTRFRLGGGNGINENFMVWEPDMKFDVIIGNPPYNADDTTKEDKNHRGQGKNIAKSFILKSLDLANKFVLLVAPYGHRTYSPVVKKQYIKNGLYKIYSCCEHFKQVTTNPCVFMFDKTNVTFNEVDDEMESDLEIPENNLSKIFMNQPGKLNREEFEHELSDNGKYTIIVTTSIVKYTDDKYLVEKINDRSIGNWRVVMNCVTSKKTIGKLLIASPDVILSRSVHCLVTKSEKEALKLKNFLENKDIDLLLEKVKTSVCNAKKFIQYIQYPDE